MADSLVNDFIAQMLLIGFNKEDIANILSNKIESIVRE